MMPNMAEINVLLLGGAPKAGTTTLARALSVAIGWDVIATDDLGAAARAMTTPDSHPDLHPMAGVDWREYYIERSDEALFDEALRAHRAAWPAIAHVVMNRASWGQHAIIEGWALLPELAATISHAAVRSIWLAADSSELDRRVRLTPEFFRGASDPETMIARFVKRSIAVDTYAIASARARVVEVVRSETSDAQAVARKLASEMSLRPLPASPYGASGDSPSWSTL
jgi:2-phosphoglycerate kinase